LNKKHGPQLNGQKQPWFPAKIFQWDFPMGFSIILQILRSKDQIFPWDFPDFPMGFPHGIRSIQQPPGRAHGSQSLLQEVGGIPGGWSKSGHDSVQLGRLWN